MVHGKRRKPRGNWIPENQFIRGIQVINFKIYSKPEMSRSTHFKCNNNDSSNIRYVNQLYFMIKLFKIDEKKNSSSLQVCILSFKFKFKFIKNSLLIPCCMSFVMDVEFIIFNETINKSP